MTRYNTFSYLGHTAISSLRKDPIRFESMNELVRCEKVVEGEDGSVGQCPKMVLIRAKNQKHLCEEHLREYKKSQAKKFQAKYTAEIKSGKRKRKERGRG